MQNYAFLLDAPTGDADTSWVQVAKTGSFTDPRYGKFKITLADFAQWIKNFTELSTGEGRLGIPVDVDHSPEKTGDTEAVGWVKQLEQRGNELWGSVEWNSEGKALVSDRRYAYISPSYSHNYKDETGKAHGTALVGIALTNRPFLQMATVNLSQASFAQEEAEPAPAPAPEPPAYSRRQMDINAILTALSLDRKTLGVADDADDAVVLTALAAHQAKPATPAVPEGHMVLSQEQVATLTAQAAAGAHAAEQLRVSTFEDAFTGAQKDGKVVLSQKVAFREMYDLNGEKTLALLSTMQPVVSMSPVGQGGTAADLDPTVRRLASEYADTASLTPMEVDREGLAILAKAEEIERTQKVPFTEALALAQAGV